MQGSLYFQCWAADEDDLIWLWVYEDIYGYLEQIQAQRVVDNNILTLCVECEEEKYKHQGSTPAAPYFHTGSSTV